MGVARRDPAFARFVVLFTGATVLAATYFAARAEEWSEARQISVALGFLTLASLAFFGAWWWRRGGPGR